MNYKYNIGDLVRVKDNAHQIASPIGFVDEMLQYRGNTYRIKAQMKGPHCNYYHLENAVSTGFSVNWNFDEVWLEEPEPEITIDENEMMEMFR